MSAQGRGVSFMGRSLRRVLRPVIALAGRPVAALVERVLRLSARQVGIALIYHSVDPVQGDLERQIVPPHGAELFEAQVRHLKRRYRVVAADELPAIVKARRRGERFPVAITFDDDLQCHTDVVLPILVRAGATATFFLTGSSLESPLALWWERLQRAFDSDLDLPELQTVRASSSRARRSIHEIGRDVERMSPPDREAFSATLAEKLGPDPPESGLRTEGVRTLVAAEMSIGFHTARHDPLPTLDDDALSRAMTVGRDELETVVGRKLNVIAYPHGHVDSRVVAAARSAGFDFGYTTRVEPVRPDSEPLLLGRLGPSYRSTGHFALQLVRCLLQGRHQ